MMKDSQENYRLILNDSESAPEPMPPTEISVDANKKLLSWGLTEEAIERIRIFSSSFRYNLWAERIKLLSRSPFFISFDEDNAYIEMPQGNGPGSQLIGNCGNLARGFLYLAHFTGLLSDLNLDRKKDIRLRFETRSQENLTIVPQQFIGQSKTHFCNPGDTHLWSGLALVNQSHEILSSIYIDVSFQKIMTPHESGYRPRYVITDPNSMEINNATVLEAGELIKVSDGYSYRNPSSSLIIGASRDMKYVYGLSFCGVCNEENDKLSKDTHFLPVVTRINADGRSLEYIFDHETNEVKAIGGNTDNEDDLYEVNKILEACTQLKATPDRDQHYSRPRQFTMKW